MAACAGRRCTGTSPCTTPTWRPIASPYWRCSSRWKTTWPRSASCPSRSAQQEAVCSAQTFLQLEQARYDSGIDPYIDVTIAQTTLLSNQLYLVNLHVQDMTASVALIQALGGGWDRSQLPTTDQVTQAPSGPETAIQN